MSTEVAAWTPIIIKGQTFSTPLSFQDDATGAPLPYTDVEIVVTPTVGSPFTWNATNGQITFVSAGVYNLSVPYSETASYEWTSGRYRLSVVNAALQPIPCLTEGLIFAKDC